MSTMDESTTMDAERATDGGKATGRETREREAAVRRGEERERAEREGARRQSPHHLLRHRSQAAQVAFTALAENVRDYAIFLMDPSGVITFWGEGARLIKWWSPAQAEGAHLRLLYPDGGSDDGTAESHLASAAEHGEYTGEGLRVRSDGSTFWAGVTLTALRDEEGTLLGFAKVTRDLTARRAADATLLAAREQAEEARIAAVAASRAKSEFLATMSHEIRTPLNAILGYHELLDLEVDGTLTPGQRRYLERAAASGRHLLGLIDEILDFSRLEAERTDVAQTVFRVGDVVATSLSIVEPQAQSRHIELINSVSGFAAQLAAQGDPDRVRQILLNLLSNAVKFTAPRPDTAGRITVSAGAATEPSPDAQVRGSGPWVYIRVEDTGAGVPAHMLQAVFEPFVQVDMSHTRPHGGTGLGLAISRKLARLMGGDLTAKSEVGVGSTFVLWLPADVAGSIPPDPMEGHGFAGAQVVN